MSNQPDLESVTVPLWLRAARHFYGAAFGARSQPALSDAMADWRRMEPSEQRFVLAHLQYLSLEAQGTALRTVTELGMSIEELGEEALEVAGLFEGPDEIELVTEPGPPDQVVTLDDADPVVAVDADPPATAAPPPLLLQADEVAAPTGEPDRASAPEPATAPSPGLAAGPEPGSS